MIKSSPGTTSYRETPLILVVDDDHGARKLFQRILQQDGYRVLTASNGRRAWQVACDERPQAAIIDMLLPGELQGLTLCRRLKENSQTSGIHVLLVTGEFMKEEDRVKGLKAGAIEYFRKPVSVPDLLAKIKTLIPVAAGMKTSVAGMADLPAERINGAPAAHKARINPPPPKILVLDDDEDHNHYIQVILEKAGYLVLPALSAKEAMAWLRDPGKPDLAILDVTLSHVGADGLSLCKSLKESPETRRIPAIILTGNASNQNRIEADAAGADTVLTKPISDQEITKAVARLLRASQQQKRGVLHRGGFELDPDKGTIFFHGKTAEFAADRQFRLLELLTQHSPNPLSRAYILAGLRLNAKDRAVDVLVNRLRKRLKTEFGEELIETIPNEGYRLNPSHCPAS